MIAAAFQRRARALWDRIPGTRVEILLLWALGLALGIAVFRSTLALSLPAALVCWAAVAGLGLLLVWRAEPILWEEETPGERAAESGSEPGLDQAPPPETTRVRPLLELIPIPGGTFQMGSPAATEAQVMAFARDWAQVSGGKPEDQMQQAREWLKQEQPAHRVHLSPFLMGRVPVTRGQWRVVLPNTPTEWSQMGDDDDLPATHVDWPQSLGFCNALSQREGLTPCYRSGEQGEWHWDREADGYRLPTEAEWECACRAGTESQWFWGDDPEGAEAHAWYSGNSGRSLHPVGSKTANPWGLHDMSGLAWEWCWDRFGAYPEGSGTTVKDPAGPGAGDSRVVRGGSFVDPPDFLRSAFRDFVRPDVRRDDLGLRCVRSRARQP